MGIRALLTHYVFSKDLLGLNNASIPGGGPFADSLDEIPKSNLLLEPTYLPESKGSQVIKIATIYPCPAFHLGEVFGKNVIRI